MNGDADGCRETGAVHLSPPNFHVRRVVAGHAAFPGVDTYLLSYPKAGRTWLRALIGKVLVDRYGPPEAPIIDEWSASRT
jgi:hypothetical protein